MLEGRGPSVEAEAENPVLPVTAGGAEGGFGLCFWCQSDLPVALFQVQGGDKSGSPQMLPRSVINSGKGVAVELRDMVEPPELVAKAGAAVRDHHNGTARFFNDPIP